MFIAILIMLRLVRSFSSYCQDSNYLLSLQHIPSHEGIGWCVDAENTIQNGLHPTYFHAEGVYICSVVLVAVTKAKYSLQLYELDGVLQVQDAHFWTLCSNVHLGSLRLETLSTVDSRLLLAQAKAILSQV